MADYNADNNPVVWFDIPVPVLGRAQKIYESVLDIKIFREKFDDF
jgi:predicted enzyme related to lactoylglutathione lyase